MADRSIIIPSEFVDDYDIVVDDLSVWEFINPSSSEDDDQEQGDLDDFSLAVTEDDLTTDEVCTEPSKEEGLLEFGSPCSDISMESLSAQLHQLNDGVVGGGVGVGVVVTDVAAVDVVDDDDDYGKKDDGDDDYDDYGKKDDGDDDYDDYADGYDLDDELVPWGLSDKFGRQRIRKLGKRACPRMNKAKRLPCRYNKPGCVHGKHGFGVQYSYI